MKLRKEHPGENNAFVCKPNNPDACYVKGRLQLTRSIGDAYLKYHEFNAPAGVHRSAGRHIPPPFTPPYVSHEPEMHHVNLCTSDKFLVIASDGIWDFLSPQEAVEIVSSCGSKNATEAAALLVEKTIERAASRYGECLTPSFSSTAAITFPPWPDSFLGLSASELQMLPTGSDRRRKHDDTTVVVLYF